MEGTGSSRVLITSQVCQPRVREIRGEFGRMRTEPCDNRAQGAGRGNEEGGGDVCSTEIA